jgi:hypothetical protein
MAMSRTFLGLLLAMLAWPAPVTRADDDAPLRPCTIAIKGDSPVQKACREGGVDRAKATMKRMLGQARGKQRGRHWACDDCHADDDTWKLSEDARTRFKELLALSAE